MRHVVRQRIRAGGTPQPVQRSTNEDRPQTREIPQPSMFGHTEVVHQRAIADFTMVNGDIYSNLPPSDLVSKYRNLMTKAVASNRKIIYRDADITSSVIVGVHSGDFRHVRSAVPESLQHNQYQSHMHCWNLLQPRSQTYAHRDRSASVDVLIQMRKKCARSSPNSRAICGKWRRATIAMTSRA